MSNHLYRVLASCWDICACDSGVRGAQVAQSCALERCACSEMGGVGVHERVRLHEEVGTRARREVTLYSLDPTHKLA